VKYTPIDELAQIGANNDHPQASVNPHITEQALDVNPPQPPTADGRCGPAPLVPGSVDQGITTGPIDMRERAVAIARMGYRVFKLQEDGPRDEKGRAPGKLPAVKAFFDEASSDPARVYEMWTEAVSGDPLHNNIGISTDGLLVVDVDTKDGKKGAESLELLVDAIGLGTATREARTTSGGRHLYYRMPGGEQVAGSAGKVAPGIDIRGHHGLVVAPGSFVDGKEYTWANDLPMIDAPQPLIDQCGKPAEKSADAHVWVCEADLPENIARYDNWLKYAPDAIEGAGGRDVTMSVFRRGGDMGVSLDTTIERMLPWNETKAHPSWNDFDEFVTVGTEAFKSRKTPLGCRTAVGEFTPRTPEEAAALDEVISYNLAWAEKKAAKSDRPRIISSSQFVNGFTPPDYLLDGILQRRFFYSNTAPTGAGKTAVALRLAAHVALGIPLGDRRVEQGRVLFFAGENPDDVRMRWIALAEHMKFDVDTIEVHFIPGVFDIDELEARIKNEVEALGGVALIVIDTSAAYFPGDDENDNKQMGDHARRLRRFTNAHGGPCVIANCHPPKHAKPENLFPRGGGAFLAEVDGNLVCLKTDLVVDLSWQGKFRGPDFDSIPFELVPVTAVRLKDSKGRSISTVIAVPLSEAGQATFEAGSRSEEDTVLEVLATADKPMSIAQIAKGAGWMSRGKPHKSKAFRVIERLTQWKLVTKTRGGAVLTKEGKEAAQKALRKAKKNG
jgi:hypothetical protein